MGSRPVTGAVNTIVGWLFGIANEFSGSYDLEFGVEFCIEFGCLVNGVVLAALLYEPIRKCLISLVHSKTSPICRLP